MNIHTVLWLLWFVLGTCIGSFLNVCIHRMPREQSIVRPRSRCPHCERLIGWSDNIPLLSFAVLRGTCRYCRRPISWRYPIVELLTGICAVVVFRRFGAGTVGIVYFAFICALIAASFIDLDFQIIPDEISVGGLVVGLLLSFAIPQLHGMQSHWLGLARSLIGMLVGGGVLYGTGLVGDLLFRRESMGGGDIKLLAMAGSILGWKLVLVTFFIAPVIALVPGLLVLLFKRSNVIPYGPFLSIALVVSLFYGAEIIRLSGMGETVAMIREYYKSTH